MPLDHFAGKFHMTSQDNIDEYLKAVGLNPAVRAMAHVSKPHMDCTVNGDELSVHIHGALGHDVTVKLHLDQESEVKTPDGRQIKVLLHLEGDKLVQRERWANKEATVIHEVNGDEWISTLNCGGVQARRHFMRD